MGPVAVDASGATVKVGNLAGAGYMPVVAIPFEGELHVRPAAVAPGVDGHVHLMAVRAEHFLNYNGYGYDDPPSLYKLRWHVQAGAGDYTLTVHYQGSHTPAPLDVWVDGHSYLLALPEGKRAAVLHVRRDSRAFPYAMQVELTPQAPFHKGDRLPATVESVELAPFMQHDHLPTGG